MAKSSKLLSRLASLPEVLSFGQWPIEKRIVFYASESSFAFTNLKPVIPGHVLVSPIRVVDRIAHLNDAEVRDLFATARIVGQIILKAHPNADSLTFTVQDGPSAGQTVPHVHVHIMPRWGTDRFNLCKEGNDSVYESINKAESGMVCENEKMDELPSIPARTRQEMSFEAEGLLKVAIDLCNSDGI